MLRNFSAVEKLVTTFSCSGWEEILFLQGSLRKKHSWQGLRVLVRFLQGIRLLARPVKKYIKCKDLAWSLHGLHFFSTKGNMHFTDFYRFRLIPMQSQTWHRLQSLLRVSTFWHHCAAVFNTKSVFSKIRKIIHTREIPLKILLCILSSNYYVVNVNQTSFCLSPVTAASQKSAYWNK